MLGLTQERTHIMASNAARLGRLAAIAILAAATSGCIRPRLDQVQALEIVAHSVPTPVGIESVSLEGLARVSNDQALVGVKVNYRTQTHQCLVQLVRRPDPRGRARPRWAAGQTECVVQT